jgi:hypothetical protein
MVAGELDYDAAVRSSAYHCYADGQFRAAMPSHDVSLRSDADYLAEDGWTGANFPDWTADVTGPATVSKARLRDVHEQWRKREQSSQYEYAPTYIEECRVDLVDAIVEHGDEVPLSALRSLLDGWQIRKEGVIGDTTLDLTERINGATAVYQCWRDLREIVESQSQTES